MAHYALVFAHLRRAKAIDSQARRRQAVVLLAMMLRYQRGA